MRNNLARGMSHPGSSLLPTGTKSSGPRSTPLVQGPDAILSGAATCYTSDTGLIGFDVATEGATDRAGGDAPAVKKASLASRQRQRDSGLRQSGVTGGNGRDLLVVALRRHHYEAGSERVAVTIEHEPCGEVEVPTEKHRAVTGSDRDYARERGCFGRVADRGSIPRGSTPASAGWWRGSRERRPLTAGKDRHVLSTAPAGPARRWAGAVAGLTLLACGSAPDASFTAGLAPDLPDAATGSGSRPFRELRPVSRGGSEMTQGDSGPVGAGGAAANGSTGGAQDSNIAAGGSITIDAGGKQGSGGSPGSGGTAPGSGGATLGSGGASALCAAPPAPGSWQYFQACAHDATAEVSLCGPQSDGCGGVIQCRACLTCDPLLCPPCPVSDALHWRGVSCCAGAYDVAKCGCVRPCTPGVGMCTDTYKETCVAG